MKREKVDHDEIDRVTELVLTGTAGGGTAWVREKWEPAFRAELAALHETRPSATTRLTRVTERLTAAMLAADLIDRLGIPIATRAAYLGDRLGELSRDWETLRRELETGRLNMDSESLGNRVRLAQAMRDERVDSAALKSASESLNASSAAQAGYAKVMDRQMAAMDAHMRSARRWHRRATVTRIVALLVLVTGALAIELAKPPGDNRHLIIGLTAVLVVGLNSLLERATEWAVDKLEEREWKVLRVNADLILRHFRAFLTHGPIDWAE